MRRRLTPNHRFVTVLARALCLAMVCTLCGCYKRVVGAEGPGSDRYDIYEPNLKKADDSLLPERQVPTQTTPTKKAKP